MIFSLENNSTIPSQMTNVGISIDKVIMTVCRKMLNTEMASSTEHATKVTLSNPSPSGNANPATAILSVHTQSICGAILSAVRSAPKPITIIATGITSPILEFIIFSHCHKCSELLVDLAENFVDV